MTETIKTQESGGSYDIVIVGGGMVGISLALLLAEQQYPWKVLLLEAQAYQQSVAPVGVFRRLEATTLHVG